jgi:hypothetical protein
MLDGLLSALLFERTGDARRAVEEIPLGRIGRMWCGSQVLLEGPCEAVPAVHVMALRAAIDLYPAAVRGTGRAGRYPAVDQTRGPYQNRVDTRRAYEAHAVWFAGFGDVAAVHDLLADVAAVGTKRSSGYGRIREGSLELEPIEAGHPGVMLCDGSPARAVPIGTWRSLGGRDDIEIAAEITEPPYWQGDKLPCAVPTHLVVSRDAAASLVGLAGDIGYDAGRVQAPAAAVPGRRGAPGSTADR